MDGLVFITATAADTPFINRLLLYIRDWEYGEDPSWDRFRIVTSKIDPLDKEGATVPPVQGLGINEWAGESVGAVERFINEAVSRREGDGSSDGESRSPSDLGTFLIVDDNAAREGNVILLDRELDFDAEPIRRLESFRKVRVPWDQAYITWCNLNIGNMGFEDFVDGEKGGDGKGWWVWEEMSAHPDENVERLYDESKREVERKRDGAIKALRELDLA